MPITMPELFRETLESSHLLDVDGWWSEIDDNARAEAIAFWNTVASEHITGFHIQASVAINEDSDPADGYWNNEFYDYLINHEVRWFEERTYHICRATACAESCVRHGRIPCDFKCPISSTECFMTAILAHARGGSVVFRLIPNYLAR